jgi:hypothetical protein
LSASTGSFSATPFRRRNRIEYDTEWNNLLNALVLHQNCYQIAWLLSILALLLLVPFVLVFGL